MSNTSNNSEGFKSFAAKRIVIGTLLAVVALWVLGIIFGFFDKPDALQKAQERQEQIRQKQIKPDAPVPVTADTLHTADDAYSQTDATHTTESTPAAEGTDSATVAPVPSKDKVTEPHTDTAVEKKEAVHETASGAVSTLPDQAGPQKEGISLHTPSKETGDKSTAAAQTDAHGAVRPMADAARIPKGVKFVKATIQPLEYELTERWWGWRPNDILNFSDNVNNYQLGVLEVTRRTAVALAERLSRTGTTAAFDKNLENAMNWFMVTADRYWFPSPEGKYKEGIDELRQYMEKLKKEKATFFTRADNLIPLLMAYEDLLGSCDENLVKAQEEDGSSVSFFRSDDYFYYAQGVASAMATILEAVQEDFIITLESRHGAEVLHHAIESCHRARDIDPWIITEAGLGGILANHRANVAAPISHARFYLGVLIKTLST